MKKLLLLIIIAVAAYVGIEQQRLRVAGTPEPRIAQTDSVLARAFENHLNGVQVQGQGRVTKILADDLQGIRHQRFIVQVGPEQTILIAHNIDIAPRIPSIHEGDTVEFKGEYAWNPKGGVVHWTHHDPSGRHLAGWLKYNGRLFQ